MGWEKEEESVCCSIVATGGFYRHPTVWQTQEVGWPTAAESCAGRICPLEAQGSLRLFLLNSTSLACCQALFSVTRRVHYALLCSHMKWMMYTGELRDDDWGGCNSESKYMRNAGRDGRRSRGVTALHDTHLRTRLSLKAAFVGKESHVPSRSPSEFLPARIVPIFPWQCSLPSTFLYFPSACRSKESNPLDLLRNKAVQVNVRWVVSPEAVVLEHGLSASLRMVPSKSFFFWTRFIWSWRGYLFTSGDRILEQEGIKIVVDA